MVELDVGESRRYRLPGHIGGGYRWSAEVIDGSAITAAIEIDPAAAAVNMGSGSPEVVVIEAMTPGAATIEVTQRRSWETDRPPIDRRRIDVRVTAIAEPI